MKKILVPCDFSESAISAFRFAIDIANKSEGEIILFHVMELSGAPGAARKPTLSSEEKAYLKEAEKNLDEIISKWAKGRLVISRQVQYGIVDAIISDFVKAQKVDLIVMGTKGCTIGFKEILVGSTTEKIVRSSIVPVMAIKKYEKNPIKSIVLANSLLEEKEELIKEVKDLQNLFGATLHIVYVRTKVQSLPDHDTQQKLDAFVKRHALKDCTITIHNDLDAESGLINFTREIKADMIAMGTHGRKGLAHIFHRNVWDSVKNLLDCPILTFKI